MVAEVDLGSIVEIVDSAAVILMDDDGGFRVESRQEATEEGADAAAELLREEISDRCP